MPWAAAESENYRADDRGVIESGEPKLDLIEIHVTAAGQQIGLDTSKVPLVDRSGKIVGVLGIFVDITEGRERDLELDQVRNHLDMAVAAMNAGIVLYDKNNRFVLCNDVYRSIYPESSTAMQPGAHYLEISQAYALKALELEPKAAARWPGGPRAVWPSTAAARESTSRNCRDAPSRSVISAGPTGAWSV